MLTILKNEQTSVRVRLNPSKIAGNVITLTLNSPSRPSLEFTATIVSISGDLYSFELTANQTNELIDNTYNYIISQGSYVLKTGDVNLI